jgi:hypothetical protein
MNGKEGTACSWAQRNDDESRKKGVTQVSNLEVDRRNFGEEKIGVVTG